MRIRTMIVAAAATSMLGLGLVATGGPAQASSGLFLYKDTGYSGGLLNLGASKSNLRDIYSGNWSDKTSSVQNRSSVAWVLYDDAGYGDRRYCILPGQRISNLHSDSWRFGDKISSVKKLSTTSCSGYPKF